MLAPLYDRHYILHFNPDFTEPIFWCISDDFTSVMFKVAETIDEDGSFLFKLRGMDPDQPSPLPNALPLPLSRQELGQSGSSANPLVLGGLGDSESQGIELLSDSDGSQSPSHVNSSPPCSPIGSSPASSPSILY